METITKEQVKFYKTGHYLKMPNYETILGDVVTVWGKIKIGDRDYKKHKSLTLLIPTENPVHKQFQDSTDGTFDDTAFHISVFYAEDEVLSMLQEQINRP